MNQNNNQVINNDEIEIDIVEILFLLRSKLLILFLSMVVFAGLLYGYTSLLIQPLYSSTGKLFILTKSTSLTSLADIQVGTQLTQDYIELVQSRPVVDTVIKNLNLQSSYEDVLEQISVSNPNNTRLLVITVNAAEPETAKAMVDEFIAVSKSSISKIMRTDEPSVVEYGHIGDKPVNVHVARNTVIGAILGLFIAGAIIIVLYLINDTIKTSDDIEKYLGLNTLASIPMSEEEKQASKKLKKSKRRSK